MSSPTWILKESEHIFMKVHRHKTRCRRMFMCGKVFSNSCSRRFMSEMLANDTVNHCIFIIFHWILIFMLQNQLKLNFESREGLGIPLLEVIHHWISIFLFLTYPQNLMLKNIEETSVLLDFPPRSIDLLLDLLMRHYFYNFNFYIQKITCVVNKNWFTVIC